MCVDEEEGLLKEKSMNEVDAARDRASEEEKEGHSGSVM